MVIGRHECKIAGNTHLKEAIAIGLDEAMTAFEECFYDLSDEQAWKFPISARNNIAWIVMHCLDNLDEYAVGAQTGQRLLPDEPRWDLWQCSADQRPKPGDSFPHVREMLDLLERIRQAATPAIEKTEEATLLEQLGPKLKSGWYMRTICHTNAHVRQIWLLRGALGLTDGKSWPQQHWA